MPLIGSRWSADEPAMILRPSLINYGEFRAHSGGLLPWKIDADALSDDDITALANLIHERISYSKVIGIPRGGLRLAAALLAYEQPGNPTLIVDDVLTTGRSMAAARQHEDDIGVVIFARGSCQDWVLPIFTVADWAK